MDFEAPGTENSKTSGNLPPTINNLGQYFSMFVPVVPLCTVHLVEVTGDDVINSYFWIGKPDTIQQTLYCKRLRTDGRAFLKSAR